MSVTARTLGAQRRILAVMLILVALLFWRSMFSVFSMVKGTVILLALVGLLTWSAVRVSQTRRAFLPVGLPVWAVAGFAAALILATVTSPNVLASLAGQGGRFTGLVMYGAYVLLFCYAVRLYRDHPPTHLIQALVVAAVPATAYGYLQLFGRDPFGWGFREHGPPMFATLGNPNFFAAWIGIVAVLAFAGALLRSLSPGWRTACAAIGIVGALAAAVSQSLQGPVAFAAGGALLGVVALWTHDGPLRRWRVPLLAVLGGLGAVVAGALVAGIGPLGTLRDMALGSYRSRAGKWEAAWAMFADRPLLGQGLDQYAERYWTYRSVDEAVARGLLRNVDAAHSVPLDMLASGGLLLGLTYLAVLGVVVWSIVVGLRRLEGDQRMLLAGFAGAWVAYQVQSAVSIDVPALALLGWLSAGVVVALAGTATLREVVLRGAPKPLTVRPGKRPKKRQPEPVAAVPAWVKAAIGVATGLAVIVVLWPLSVDRMAGGARDAARAGRSVAAAGAWEQAARLAPWDARYAAEHAHHLARTGQREDAMEAYEVAWQREQSLFRALTPARMAARRGHDAGRVWFDRAVAVDGAKTTTVLKEAGEFFLEDDAERARRVYQRAVELYPDNHHWWTGLGEALALAGDPDGARAAFERALQINPDAEEAQEGLQRLG